ncbi:unnamed protein product [Arctia plantaginis]|uniref:HTH CENPB-type domain-containing protein n=1 Tax=Arctia plantaginis TaxID=874455 RepID=A0A8S1B9J4_ARCPL|nr:unnamed protein product [Arctia plantaginis]
MEKNGFPLTSKEVKALVSEYIKRNGIVTPFREDMPGDDWLRGFRKRNGLSLKKPQSVEIARKRACNPFTVYEYFDLLESVLKDLDLTDKPQRIYNLDETSFSNDPSKTRVIGQKGFRCTRTTSSPGRENTTVLLAANAVGDKVPPLIVFQGKHLWNEWCYKDPYVKTAYTVSRKDLNVIKLAQSENITILKLPPHSSDTLQPLDCSGMKPMKDRWDEALVKWQRLHIGAKLPKSEFARILTEIWSNLNPVILQNGFKKTGIYPFNRQAISQNIFDPLALARWEKEQALTHNVEDNEVEYVNLFTLPEEENTLLTFDKNLNDCTHQIVQNQVYFNVPTLLSLTLQNFNMIGNCLEDAKTHKNCTEVKVTDKQDEMVTEYDNSVNANSKENQIQVEIAGSTIFDQEIIGNKTSIYVKEKYVNTKKQGKKEPRVYEKQKPGHVSSTQKQDSFEQVRKSTSAGTKSNTSSKIIILENVLIKPAATSYNKENRELKKELQEKLKTYEKKQHSIILGNHNETAKIEINQNQQHSQKSVNLDKYAQFKHENEAKTNVMNVSFQELLLKKIGHSDPPKTKKKRVTRGAEILTYNEVIDRMEKEQEEKQRKTEEKQARQKRKLKKKTLTKKKKTRYESDSNTSGSFQSNDSSEAEDPETFYKSLLENNSDNDSIYLEDNSSNVPTFETPKRETRNKNIDIYQISKPGTKTKQTRKKTCLTEKENKSSKRGSYVQEESQCVIYNMLESVASTSKQEFVFVPKEGDFVLAKFSSALGKKTYKYVCLIEDITGEKAVVKGLKSYKQKNTFKLIKNDVSIIDFTDIITVLPQPDCVGELYKFSENINVIEK